MGIRQNPNCTSISVLPVSKLSKLPGGYSVTLIWVTGHYGINGNKKVVAVARTGSALDISGEAIEPLLAYYSSRILWYYFNKAENWWNKIPKGKFGSFTIRQILITSLTWEGVIYPNFSSVYWKLHDWATLYANWFPCKEQLSAESVNTLTADMLRYMV